MYDNYMLPKRVNNIRYLRWHIYALQFDGGKYVVQEIEL